MIRRGELKKILAIGAIFVFVLSMIPIAVGETPEVFTTTPEENEPIPKGNEHFSNCKVFVMGKCNYVEGPILWKLGFYANLFEKDFTIEAKGEEGEKLSAFVFAGQIGLFLGYETMDIELDGATGMLFYGGKSLIFQGNRIIAFCEVQDLWINYPD
jgi:hypothetical protein